MLCIFIIFLLNEFLKYRFLTDVRLAELKMKTNLKEKGKNTDQGFF